MGRIAMPLYGVLHDHDERISCKMSHFRPAIVTLGLILAIHLFLNTSSGILQTHPSEDIDSPRIRLPRSARMWAQYSPWFPAGGYTVPRLGCAVTQVNILQRHGARFPTSDSSTRIKTAISKLKSVKSYRDPKMRFLKDFTYRLGANDLVSLGAAESFDAGKATFERYSALVSEDNLPFVRASSSERVVLSASNWTSGFASVNPRTFHPVVSVILDEAFNDTLDDHMCPKAGDADIHTNQWLSVFAPPITVRLNAAAPEANLTNEDTYNLMSLCPFDTVAEGTESQVCRLFTEDDFEGFEYFGDLNKYYGNGYGQKLGPVQGVGYVNELLSRLTGKPVHDHTQTNSTLDSSPVTFPLNCSIYADFSHDNQMIAIYSAIGLFRQSMALDPTMPDAERTWLASRLVPFSSRMVTEKIVCGGEAYVRILVNDEVQSLEFCGADGDGLCALDDFVESQGYARSGGDGDFAKCFD